jgi:hypothetical protein
MVGQEEMHTTLRLVIYASYARGSNRSIKLGSLTPLPRNTCHPFSQDFMTDQKFFCRACGKPNREQARFCGHCGRPLQDTGLETRVYSPGSVKREEKPIHVSKQEVSESGQGSREAKMMKTISFTVIIAVVLGLFAYTNPTMESYENFVHQKIIQETRAQKDEAAQAFGFLFGGLASRFVVSQTIRNDYIFLSTYDTAFGDEHLRALGILKNFIILETPQSLRSHN